MLLYHGTNGGWVGNIIRKGLEPRKGKSARNNWKHVKHQSNHNCVYLTNSYAPYFAMNATRGVSCAVLEIDTDFLDLNKLYPDEDFLEQANRTAPADRRVAGDLSDRVIHFRQNMFKFTWATGDLKAPMWWQASLLYLGTCAHRGVIPSKAISRIVLWDHSPKLIFAWDLSVTLMNQKICGPRYQKQMQLLMDGIFVEPEEVTKEMRAQSVLDVENAFLVKHPGWECFVPAKGLTGYNWNEVSMEQAKN